LDLVLAEEANGVVGVLLGNGNGTFGSQSTFGAGAIACAVVVGDFNGDGKLDVAAANYGSNNVSVLLGNGNGSFAGQKTFATGTNPFSLGSGDVNRDGRVDLVAGDFGSSNVSVLTGDVLPCVVSINRSNPSSQGTTATTVTFAVNFNEAVTGVDATDFALALSGVTASTPAVVSGSGASYSVTVSGISGTGTVGLNLVDDGSIHDLAGNALARGVVPVFGTPRTFAAGAQPGWMAVGDLNGDGRVDVVTSDGGPSHPYANTIDVLMGNGDGSFKAKQQIAVGVYPASVTIADVNRDGKADLIVGVDRTNSFVGVLLGNGDGTFKQEHTFAVGQFPDAPVVGDFNGDGAPDLAVTTENNVAILLGNGDGTFKAQQTFFGNDNPGDTKVADVNRDGRLDLVIANPSSPNAFPNGETTMLGNGDGTFQTLTTVSTGGQPGGLAISDLNRDGQVDAILSDTGGPDVAVLLGNGNATFQAVRTFASGSTFGGLDAGDVNGDGIPDVVMTNAGFSNYPNHNLAVMLGNGDGTLAAPVTFAAGNGPESVAVSDVNGDGVADLLVSDYGDGTVGVILGGGNGNFTGQAYTIVPPGPTTYVVQKLSQLGTNATGASPQAGLTVDGAGNFYGTTQNGGAFGDGTIFRIAAGSSTITPLASFNGVNGAYPFMGVAVDGAGNIFGTTRKGGDNNGGTIYELPAGSSTIKVLHSFDQFENDPNGQYTQGMLTVDAAGNVYGTVIGGGYDGSVFEIAHDTLALTTLATFSTTGGELGGPSGALVVDGAGNVFGTAQLGGAHSDGGVFEIPLGSGFAYTVASFAGTNGYTPVGGLVRDGAGNLYGTTRYGGSGGEGTVFEIPAHTGSIVTLGSFTGLNGEEPLDAPVLDMAGNLYGTTSGGFFLSGNTYPNGTVFKIAAGTTTVTQNVTCNPKKCQ